MNRLLTVLTLLTACAASQERVVLDAPCTVKEGPCTPQVLRLQVDPVIAPGQADEAERLLADFATIEATCPSFADRFVWLSCDDSPCLAYMWPKPGPFDLPWSEATCGAATMSLSYAGVVLTVSNTQSLELEVHHLGPDVRRQRELVEPLLKRAANQMIEGPIPRAVEHALKHAPVTMMDAP